MVELLLILARLRISTTIALSTATIWLDHWRGDHCGAAAGQYRFLASGRLIVGLLAVLIHDALAALERWQLARIGR